MIAQARVTPKLLHWARERAQLSPFDLAKKLPVKPEQITAWENGEKLPTFKQAQKLALATHVPFGFLFLKQPPQEKLPIPDLRTIGSQALSEPSPELRDTVQDVLRKQTWYIDHLKQDGAQPLAFIGQFSSNSPVKDVVTDMRRVLGIEPHNIPKQWETYFRLLVSAAEQAGILVMRSGIVGNNTHRKLDVEEFRGFALIDPLAPAVFINSADAPSAHLFTLVHELAHLWIGQVDGTEERFCNAVAGEFLAPETLFFQYWDKDADWQHNIDQLAGEFHISPLATARRAMDLGKITPDQYRALYKTLLENFQRQDGSGGSFYRNVQTKNSSRFSRAVVAETLGGRLLLRDAGKLLGISPDKIQKYANGLGK
jgi:Zn-dependent peptidase ImmA (M78 family)/DNA-binding XRE family transcriptional regulator